MASAGGCSDCTSQLDIASRDAHGYHGPPRPPLHRPLFELPERPVIAESVEEGHSGVSGRVELNHTTGGFHRTLRYHAPVQHQNDGVATLSSRGPESDLAPTVRC